MVFLPQILIAGNKAPGALLPNLRKDADLKVKSLSSELTYSLGTVPRSVILLKVYENVLILIPFKSRR